jgi:hypothetical protein
MRLSRFPRSVWIFAVVIALALTIPYIVAAVSTPSGWEYSGALVTPHGFRVDFNSHLAKMWQGSRGQWNYRILFTHEAHPGLVSVQGFYVALGALSNLTPFSFPLIYHLTRFLLTIGVVLAMWAFACRYFDGNRDRWLALLFGTIVQGWGWLLYFIAPEMTRGVAPIEFWLMDAYHLLGALFMPHFATAIILQIVALIAYEDWLNSSSLFPPRTYMRYLVMMTFALALDAVIQPYVILLIVPLIGILTAYHVFSTKALSFRRALGLTIPLGVHGLIGLTQFLLISGDPIWANFAKQNITASPDLLYYLLGYAPFIIPIACGARYLATGGTRWLLPMIWVLLVAMLVYAPFPTQRRYLLGVQTPLAVMAAYGWSRSVLARVQKRRFILHLLYFTFSALSLILLLQSNSASLSQPEKYPDVFYQPDELAGYQWLRENAAPDSLILSTFDKKTGNGSGGKIVAKTGLRVYAGHWFETAQIDFKLEQVRLFYQPETSDDWREEFIQETEIDYIWYDESARALGRWNPADADYLEAVFESTQVTIYVVKQNPTG